ncbi:hypothetical protein GE09DRAFT_1246962 [Coniochaeta sp. 2T2.1]|nr:hypothetical protein GE09DRAFT_1246962 [Coniochaeta sp. 2T2.1]
MSVFDHYIRECGTHSPPPPYPIFDPVAQPADNDSESVISRPGGSDAKGDNGGVVSQVSRSDEASLQAARIVAPPVAPRARFGAIVRHYGITLSRPSKPIPYNDLRYSAAPEEGMHDSCNICDQECACVRARLSRPPAPSIITDSTSSQQQQQPKRRIQHSPFFDYVIATFHSSARQSARPARPASWENLGSARRAYKRELRWEYHVLVGLRDYAPDRDISIQVYSDNAKCITAWRYRPNDPIHHWCLFFYDTREPSEGCIAYQLREGGAGLDINDKNARKLVGRYYEQHLRHPLDA